MKSFVTLVLATFFLIATPPTFADTYDDEISFEEIDDELLDLEFDLDDELFDELADIDIGYLEDDDYIAEEPVLGYNEDQVRQFFEETNQVHDPFEDELFALEDELAYLEDEIDSLNFEDPIEDEILPEIEIAIEEPTLISEAIEEIEESQAVEEIDVDKEETQTIEEIEEPQSIEEEVTVAEKKIPSTEIISISDETSYAPPIPATTATVRGGIKMYEEVDEEGISSPMQIHLSQVFSGSPIIYSLLGLMSIGSFAIWLYSLLATQKRAMMPKKIVNALEEKINDNRFEEALNLCKEKDTLFCKMISSGISSRSQGFQLMLDNMRNMGRRASVKYWQRIALLNDIAIVAPMLGLLGTVLGMFYAFYDLNRSKESLTALFDGLGISVGTTVAGLIVAILAMIFHSTIKFRLVRSLTRVENEVHTFANKIAQHADHS